MMSLHILRRGGPRTAWSRMSVRVGAAARHSSASRCTKSMFCYQCEQTTHGKGCITVGVCGKTPETAALQDLLVHRLKGLAGWALHEKATLGADTAASLDFFRAAMFSTLTNVNFDESRFVDYVRTADQLTAKIRSRVAAAGKPPLEAPSVPWFLPHSHPFAAMPSTDYSVDALAAAGREVGIESRRSLTGDATLIGLPELVCYGAKGAAAYAHHAALAGVDEQAATEDLMHAMAFVCTPEAGGAPAVLDRALQVGEANLRIMKALETAHTSAYGHPSPSEVLQLSG